MTTTTTTQYVAAAALIERLLRDARFRAEFRADPVAACESHGLQHLAAEFERAAGPVTLEQRESRSALAGVLVAVACEAADALGWFADAAAAGVDVPDALQRALADDPRALPAVHR